MSTYSINMAHALRWYASTGDLAHILVRMRHLLVICIQIEENIIEKLLFLFFNRLFRATTEISMLFNWFSQCLLLVFNILLMNSALHDALIHNQTDVIRAILHAASYHNKELEFINARNNSELAPLHIAVLKNNTEATVLLLQSGANPNVADANGNTPLHLASVDKHLIDCLQLILNTASHRKTTHVLNLNARNYAGE